MCRLSIAEMDNFKYMGSYPSDTVPQLTKYFFAKIYSAPSNDRGEHWIDWIKVTTLPILWVEDQFTPV